MVLWKSPAAERMWSLPTLQVLVAQGADLLMLTKRHSLPAPPFIKTVTSIADENTFTVSEWEQPVEKVFVYGKQVDDFRTIDYNRILMLCISSVQLQEQRSEQLQDRVDELEKNYDQLEKNYNELKAQVATLIANS